MTPGAIVEVQVDCGDTPVGAHTAYWDNPEVIRPTAELLLANCS